MGALKAVIMDMDGVVTDTADAHAAAWKKLFDAYLKRRARERGEAFIPFDAEGEYRRYVDGKPRYDGVAGFLAARGIALPWGSPDDGPEAETVCGLGNAKNRFFHDWLRANSAKTYPDACGLIKRLRRARLPVGVFSASRNAKAVLESAGVLDLFDARVDGEDLAALGLPGKPDPAMLLEVARRLGAPPDRAAVIEDAVSGVEAGARGGFAAVVGVARAGGDSEQAEALRQGGATLVVAALSELAVTDTGLAVKTVARLPSPWRRERELRARIGAGRPVVLVDADILENDAGLQKALDRLRRLWPVEVIGPAEADIRDIADRFAMADATMMPIYLAGRGGRERESVFQALSANGIAVLARDGEGATSADYKIAGTGEASRFLDLLNAIADDRSAC